MCRYEVEKKLAVEREDYDTAKEKKEQLERIRQQVYDQLGIHGLLSGGGLGQQVLRRSVERSGYHPRVRNMPFTARSTTSTLFSGHGNDEGRDGKEKLLEFTCTLSSFFSFSFSLQPRLSLLESCFFQFSSASLVHSSLDTSS